MEKFFQNQLERVDKLMKIILSDDQCSLLGSALQFEDVIFFTCQSMWHLKDWILNDPDFAAKDQTKLKADIHASPPLLVCADLANGSKHFTLDRPKVGAAFSDRQGLELSSAKGIFKVYYYVICTDKGQPYHGAEIRALLADARKAWDAIIETHCLSIFS